MKTCDSAMQLSEYLSGDPVLALRAVAVFIRAFQQSPTLFVVEGCPGVSEEQCSRNLAKFWQRCGSLPSLSLPAIAEMITNGSHSHRFDVSEHLVYYRGGGVRPYLPRVRDILRDIFAGTMHRERLEQAIWEESAGFYGLRFSPLLQLAFGHLSAAANTQLAAGQAKKPFFLKHIREQLIDSLGPLSDRLVADGDASPEDYVDYFLEVLSNLSLIVARGGRSLNDEPKSPKEEMIAFRSRITPEYLLIKSQGMKTGIGGIDFLLLGGLLIPKEGASISISGPPGTGKSSIAHILALQNALLGGVSVYAALESDSILGLHTLVQFRPDEFLHVVRASSPEQVLAEPFPYSGVLLWPEVLRTDKADHFVTDLRTYLASIPRHWGNRRVLVIDPFNVVRTMTEHARSDAARRGGGSRLSHRDLLNKCLVLGKEYGFTTVFVVERGTNDLIDDHELFVVDFVMQTARDDKRNLVSLQVSKSRYQPSWPGRSALAFDCFKGPEVFPEPACISYAYRDRRSGKTECTELYWEKSFPGWQDNLGSHWWRTPSVTAMVGPKGSLKTEFLDTMLTANRKERQSRRAIVHVVLGQESLPLRPQESGSTFRTSDFRYGIRHDNLQSTVMDAEVFLVFTPHHIRAEQVIWCLMEVLLELSGQGMEMLACSLNDYASLAHGYPLIEPECGMLTAFIDLCQSFHADAVVLCTTGETGADRTLLDQLGQMAHSIIDFQSARFGGEVVYTVSVKRSLSGKHPDAIYELQVPRPGRCRIASRLRLANDVHGDSLHFVKAEITLYAETETQVAYAERMKSTYQVQYDGGVNVSVTRPNSFDWSLATSHVLTKRRLRVIQIDAYQIPPRSAEQDCPGDYVDFGRNERIGRLLSEYREDTRNNVFWKNDRGGDSPLNLAPDARSVPYYLNPSFLLLPRSHWFDGYGEDNPDTGWEWLIERAIGARDEQREQGADTVLFGCPLLTHENYNTLFLELLVYCIRKSESNGPSDPESSLTSFLFEPPGRHPRSLADFLMSHDNEVKQATLLLCQLVADIGRSPGATTSTQVSSVAGGPCPLPTNAVFYRTWYTTMTQFLKDATEMPSEKTGEYSLFFLPGRVSTRGDWHLAIPVGSSLPDEGAEFICDLCSPVAASERLRCGVGLPPHKAFYEVAAVNSYVHPASGLTLGKIDDILRHGIRRSVFDDYRSTASRMAHLLDHFTKQWQAVPVDGSRCYTLADANQSPHIRRFVDHLSDVWPGLWNDHADGRIR